MTLARTLRTVAVLALLAGLVATTYGSVQSGDFFFWNFFGYFTIQSNIIAMVVLAVSIPWTGRDRPSWLELARASATVYTIIVGVVYWTLLTDADIQVDYPWANLILHGISAVIMIADWLLEGPRRAPPVRSIGAVLIFPVLWTGVVLVRGATDGWVPYPFLDPANGYASVAVMVVVIAVTGLALGLLLLPLTRWRVVGP